MIVGCSDEGLHVVVARLSLLSEMILRAVRNDSPAHGPRPLGEVPLLHGDDSVGGCGAVPVLEVLEAVLGEVPLHGVAEGRDEDGTGPAKHARVEHVPLVSCYPEAPTPHLLEQVTLVVPGGRRQRSTA